MSDRGVRGLDPAKDKLSETLRQLRRLGGGVGEGVRIGVDSIAANRFRSGLTILGVGVGVSVVVLMAALITGVRTSIQEGIESAGPRNLFVTRFDPSEVQLTLGPGRPSSFFNRPRMTAEEARRVKALPAVANAVLSVGLSDPGSGGMTLEFEGTRVTGVSGAAESDDWPEYRAATFVQGRNFVPSEVRSARSVLVLSEQLARDLFGTRNPLGQRVRATGGPRGALPMTVIGIVQPQENPFEDGGAYLAVVPYTTAVRRMGASESSGQMIVVPQPDVSIDETEDQIIGLMRGLRGLAPVEENNFSVVRSTQILALFDRLTAVFFIVMLALSSVALLVGGVGVIGIMMISVTERTQEIGVRKAVGATGAEILWQFLVEAGFLTLVGGGAGLIFGGGVAWTVATATPVPASVPAWAVGAALAMAAVTGMLFGLLPAAKAARMEPVAALRHE